MLELLIISRQKYQMGPIYSFSAVKDLVLRLYVLNSITWQYTLKSYVHFIVYYQQEHSSSKVYALMTEFWKISCLLTNLVLRTNQLRQRTNDTLTPFSQTRPFSLQTNPSGRICHCFGGGHKAFHLSPLLTVKEVLHYSN